MPRSPWRRRARNALAALLGLTALAAAAVQLVLGHLDRPFVKARLQALVRGAAGVEVDYATATASIARGVHLTDVRVATPAPLRGLAPELARIGALDVSFGLRQLLGASRVDDVTVRDVELTIVLDEDGRSSLDLGGTTAPPVAAAGPPAPRSRALAELLARPLPVRTVTVGPVRVTVLRSAAGAIVERASIEGIRATVRAEGGRTTIALGTRAAPLVLRIERATPARTGATVELSVEVTAAPGEANAAIAARLVEQTLDPALAPLVGRAPLAVLVAGVRVDAGRGEVLATLSEASLADGALQLAGEVVLADDPARAPLLRRAEGRVDAPRVLAMAPPTLVPRLPRVASGTVELHAEQVALGALPRVLPGGQLRAHGTLRGLRVAAAGLAVQAPALRLDVRTGADRRVDADLGVDVEAARWTAGELRAAASGATATLRARGLELDPARRAGKVSVELRAATVRLEAGARVAELERPSVVVKGELAAGPPFAAALALELGKLRVRDGARVMIDDPLRADVRLSDVRPRADRPAASLGAAHAELALGPIAVVLDAKKAAGALEYAVLATSPSLGGVERALAGAGPKIAWAQMGVALRSKGTVEPLGAAPGIRHETTVSLSHPSLRGARGGLSAETLAIGLASRGDARRHEGELTLTVGGLKRAGAAMGDGRVAAAFKVDAGVPSASVRVSSTGSGVPAVTARLDATLERARRRLDFDFDVALRALDPIAGLVAEIAALRGFTVPGLELELRAKGHAVGLVEAHPGGGLRLAAAPAQAVGEATLAIKARRLAWRSQDRTIETPELGWTGELHVLPERRALHGDLALGELHVAVGPRRVDVAGVGDVLDAVLTGDLAHAQLEVVDRLTLRALRQELAPAYPTGDLTVALEARATPEGVIRVPELRIENRAAGTAITLRGGLDFGEQRRSLSLRGSLTQDLARAWTATQAFVGRGTLSADVRVDSADLRRYRTVSALRIKDGYVSLPRQKISIEAIDGEIPIVAEVKLDGGAPRFVRETEVNSYSELRFADQHPMLSRRSYLAVARVETPWATVAPLAGNLVVDNNVLSLSQLELGARGGRVTGRAVLALQGQDSRAELNVRATNVRSSHGEPFDGNAAVSVSVRQRSVQGRAEILRIGRRHLLDLLDLVDPPRADAAINRVRRALALGYPDRVSVSFNRGFAAAKITFGGLARLLRIDELRGIPMGPIIERVLEPFFDDEEE